MTTVSWARYDFVRGLLVGDLPRGATVVELGAAPGDQAAALAKAGFQVTAVDIGIASDEWAGADEGRMAALLADAGVTPVEWNLEDTPYPFDDGHLRCGRDDRGVRAPARLPDPVAPGGGPRPPTRRSPVLQHPERRIPDEPTAAVGRQERGDSPTRLDRRASARPPCPGVHRRRGRPADGVRRAPGGEHLRPALLHRCRCVARSRGGPST